MKFKYEDINKRCDEILMKRRAAAAEADKRINEANNNVKNIRVKVSESKDSGDVDGYMKASADLEEAMNKLIILKEWKQHLIDEPLISEEEYLTLFKEVNEEALKLSDQYSAELLKVAESTYTKSKELMDYMNKTNTALQKLQHDVFRDKDKPVVQNGERVQTINVRRCPSILSEVSLWASIMGKSYMYEKITGEKIDKDTSE